MTYATWAANGQGVDRHLFGLKKCVKPGEEMPELLTDEGYTKSSHWEMSTSQLSSPFFDGWGYGEGKFVSLPNLTRMGTDISTCGAVVPDGYGLAYALGKHYMRWTITSRRNMRPAEMQHYLAEAATEVRDMMEAARKAEKEKETKL
jgi:carnitine O-acetyltransferase